MKIQIVFISMLFFAFQAIAFDKKEIMYENATNTSKKVSFAFNGEIFDPPLDLFKKEDVKQSDVKQIYDFFLKFYELNKNGTKQDILTIWNPSERPQLEKDINDEVFKKNQARFKAMTGIKLKMIIEYGYYYICYLRIEFTDHKVVMKYPLILSGKGMFLSNKLNGDYFYDVISHFLDKENYKDAAMGQFVK